MTTFTIPEANKNPPPAMVFTPSLALSGSTPYRRAVSFTAASTAVSVMSRRAESVLVQCWGLKSEREK
eukprot:CAMPEP_0194392214 /NCGR_PEP_ID=MMETSP0174-20130528/120414_1 /TAXON_ID=216777 /ORGANISM="Proboscia alata, Strain PI-D3" /LENGTH=67 /DNA_ID=CAMNT_0039187355 /DNA_START=23 /DNA_END=226 /DNA_ORIENTATION=-